MIWNVLIKTKNKLISVSKYLCACIILGVSFRWGLKSMQDGLGGSGSLKPMTSSNGNLFRVTDPMIGKYLSNWFNGCKSLASFCDIACWLFHQFPFYRLTEVVFTAFVDEFCASYQTDFGHIRLLLRGIYAQHYSLTLYDKLQFAKHLQHILQATHIIMFNITSSRLWVMHIFMFNIPSSWL